MKQFLSRICFHATKLQNTLIYFQIKLQFFCLFFIDFINSIKILLMNLYIND